MAQDKANPKMAVWNQVSTTPVQYTETVHFDGRDITQIDGMYVVMRATELFGPIGKGWGFDIIEDRFDKGAPLLDKNGEVMAWELMHTLLLKLWYVHAGKRCYSTQYGHTPFVRKGQYGPYTDFDACKKSLTDAIKKCLSLAGFCADVYLGMFDDPIYVEGLELKKRLEEAGDADSVLDEAKTEFKEWLSRQISALPRCPNPRALHLMYQKIMQQARAKAVVVKFNPDDVEARINEAYEERKAELAKESNGA
ncbi:hypothetical protein [Pseudomonas sp. OTU750018]|uniref:hypothetical protein n=1 Tax=Pseudomonas sp. OTU750018 TaxID=2709708 RepID=UPI00159E73C1|nr:hypothetical protein [Pseudomonas sp. OTU750018]